MHNHLRSVTEWHQRSTNPPQSYQVLLSPERLPIPPTLSDGEVVDTAFGSAATTVDTGTVGTLHHTSDMVITPGNAWAPGDTLIVQVFRDATNVADTLNVDAHLVEVVVYANYVSLVEA